eukprot:symbB.v1.2.036424.t1/scaffold5137.1/size30495/5
MPNRGKGSGKPADEEPMGADRRLPREPLGPYDRPCPIDGDPWSRRMWAQDLRKGKSKGRIPAGLLEIMQDQLPMLTEKGLRELLISVSCELSFRGDVREQNEEVQMEYEANGGKGSAFPPDSVIEMWRSIESRIGPKGTGPDSVIEMWRSIESRIGPKGTGRGSKGAGRDGGGRGARAGDEEEDFVEEEVEYRIPPGCMFRPMIGIPEGDLVILEDIWPTRKNVPLADFNQTVANMAKPSACVQPSGIQSPGIQAPGIQAVPKSTLLANVAASSNAPPMSQGPMPLPMPQTSVPLQTKQVSTAATNPETSQGINRMRLAHERGDPLPTVEEAKVQRAKAAIFRSNLGQTVDPQVVAKALATPVEAPGLSYPPGGSMFDDHLAEFDEWEEVDIEYANGDVVYAPVLDPQADASGFSPGPRPPMGTNWQEPANIAERHRRANTHCPEDVMSYGEWGRTMIEFGKEMRGESYYAVAHGAEPRYVQYRKWARTHLERKSVLGKDFIKYLAVKEHYFGTYEDDMHYRAERIAQAKAKAAAKAVAAAKAAAAVYTAPQIPGTNRRRQYLDVAEYSSLDDPWNYDLY